MYFFDYNTVEAVLQGCAVLVNTNIGLYLLSGGPAGVRRSRLPVWRNVRGEEGRMFKSILVMLSLVCFNGVMFEVRSCLVLTR